MPGCVQLIFSSGFKLFDILFKRERKSMDSRILLESMDGRILLDFPTESELNIKNGSLHWLFFISGCFNCLILCPVLTRFG